MIYPVKIEFKLYPSGNYEDWSQYLSEPPTINRKVESDNPGEAGLIVYDNASVSFYYIEGSPVYTRFNDLNLAADKRYMFRISAPLSNKTYKPIFEGMADFSTIEWPGESRLINFEIIDKLSALAMLQSKAPRGLYQLDVDITDSIRYDITVLGQFLTLRKTVDGDPITPINPYAPGSIICRNHPSSELNKFYLVKRVVPKTITVYNENGTVAGIYDAYEALIFNDLSGYSDPPNTEDRHYYHYLPYYFNIDIGATQTIIVDGNPTEELIAFDGIKLIQALIQQQWPDISLINKTGAATFNIPLSYFEQLIFEQPFNSNPLEALKFLANTMNCYLFINSAGQAVIQSRNNLLGGAERNINSGRLISATKKYFWDKLVDGVNITAKSCIPSSTDNFLQGSSSLTYRLPNSLSRLINFEIIDKLSALAMLQSKAPRGLYQLDVLFHQLLQFSSPLY
ncbi:MAG TPA: hypothetical protein VHO28_12245 [Ignavibacteriales bacterium]|nr:hypothetical protein [Ignavibacteriales bacterium]